MEILFSELIKARAPFHHLRMDKSAKVNQKRYHCFQISLVRYFVESHWQRGGSGHGANSTAHNVRLMTGHLAKPIVEPNENGSLDAGAIAAVVQRSNMRFTSMKQTANRVLNLLQSIFCLCTDSSSRSHLRPAKPEVADINIAKCRNKKCMMDSDMVGHEALQQWDERSTDGR